MNYCLACGIWRRIVAYWRCQECYDKWLSQEGRER